MKTSLEIARKRFRKDCRTSLILGRARDNRKRKKRLRNKLQKRHEVRLKVLEHLADTMSSQVRKALRENSFARQIFSCEVLPEQEGNSDSQIFPCVVLSEETQ